MERRAPVRWVVQRPPLGDDSPTHQLIRGACELLSLPFESIDVAPGIAPRLPALDGPAVVHGRKTLLHAAHADPAWRQAVFLDFDTFTPEASSRSWGSRMLNPDLRLVAWEGLLASMGSEPLFVRPNDDDKSFTGRVFCRDELQVLFAELEARKRAVASDRVAVASAKEIDAEARLFVVDGEIVSGSFYRPDASPYLPDGLREFAQEAVRTWTPAPVFALDIARTNGVYRIVETNCFNVSRLYGADVAAVVESVGAYQRTHWQG